MPRSSSRSTAWAKVACETAEREVVHAARVGRRAVGVAGALLVGEDRDQPAVARVEVEVALRALSRLGCSKTNGMPSTPSQKSIDVCGRRRRS